LDSNKAIKLNPRNAEAFNNRAVAKWGLKDLDGAVTDYDQALELDPNYTKARINRAAVQTLKQQSAGH
jgi:Flp pilus assembly protein TadD